MRKFILFALMCLTGIGVQMEALAESPVNKAAKTPKARITAEGKEAYSEFDKATGELTFYYDELKSTRTGEVEAIDQAVRFKNYYSDVKKAVIDPSFADLELTSTAWFFYSVEGFDEYTLYKMTDIEGIENLNTSQVTDMNGMFRNC